MTTSQVKPLIRIAAVRKLGRGKARTWYEARLSGDRPKILRPQQESGDFAVYRRGRAHPTDRARARRADRGARTDRARAGRSRSAGGGRRRTGVAGRG